MEFILKSSLLIGIFYSFYKLFLQKETFFNSIRVYFIICLLLTVVFPLVIIPIYIDADFETVNLIPHISENSIIADSLIFSENSESLNNQEQLIINENPFNWILFFKTIYIFGVLVFSIKFLIEIFSLYKLVKKSNQSKKGKITFVETLKNISPFSVFNYIVYNRNLFKKSDLLQIIEHEKVHVNHKHTYDMLLIHLLVIVQWFNPFAWLYKKDVEQNLEFLADKFAQENHKDLKEYQYLLLKTSINTNPFALSTNFYNSLIKKRIIMLQKSPSKKLNQLKYLMILPLIAIFLFAFNTKEYVKSTPTLEVVLQNIPYSGIEIEKKEKQFINPIRIDKIKKVSSGYGERMNPFTQKKQLHKGVDLVAETNTKVYSTKDGEVIKAAYNSKKGNYIQIKHKDDFQTNYHHLKLISINIGDNVTAGDIIGTVGSTGKSTGSHLHYEVLKNGKNVNPINFIIANKKLVNNKIYKNHNNSLFKDNIIEITINKNTTAKKLTSIKSELEKEGVSISFKKVKRNKQNEIISIKINASNKNSKVNYENSNENGINDITIKFEDNSISIGDNDKLVMHFKRNGKHSLFFSSNSDDIHKKHKKHKLFKKHKKHKKHRIIEIDKNDGNTSIFILKGDDDENATYIINGKKMTKKEFEKMDKKNIKTIEIESEHNFGESNNFIFITKEDEDVEENEDGSKIIKKIKIHKQNDGDSNSYFYLFDDDEDDENTITTYIVNGKEMTKDEFEKFDKSKIKSLNINKESTIEKHD